MDDFLGYLKQKKNFLTVVILIIVALAIPLGVYLVQQQQIFKSSAAGESIQIAQGNCVIEKDGKKVAICTDIPLTLTNPFPPPVPRISTNPSVLASTQPTQEPTDEPSEEPSEEPAESEEPEETPTPVPSQGGVKTINATDFPNLQKAIDSLGSSGGIIMIPQGTFTQPAKTKIKSNITLQGAGMGKTIIKLVSGVNAHILYTYAEQQPIQNVHIKDLTVDGPGKDKRDSGGEECCHGVKFENQVGGSIINVESKNNGLDGIYLGFVALEGQNNLDDKRGVYNVSVTGCKVSSNGRNGFSLAQGNGNVISGCQSSNNDQGGYVLSLNRESYTGFLMKDNKFVQNRSSGNDSFGYGIGACASANSTPQKVYNNVFCQNQSSNDNKGGFARECIAHDSLYVGNSPEISSSNLGSNSKVGTMSNDGARCAI